MDSIRHLVISCFIFSIALHVIYLQASLLLFSTHQHAVSAYFTTCWIAFWQSWVCKPRFMIFCRISPMNRYPWWCIWRAYGSALLSPASLSGISSSCSITHLSSALILWYLFSSYLFLWLIVYSYIWILLRSNLYLIGSFRRLNIFCWGISYPLRIRADNCPVAYTLRGGALHLLIHLVYL